MERNNRDFLELLRDTEAAVDALLATLGARLIRIILANGQRRGRQTLQDLIDLAIRQYVESYQRAIHGARVSSITGDRSWRRRPPAAATASRRSCRPAVRRRSRQLR
jgi:hypothetical protein